MSGGVALGRDVRTGIPRSTKLSLRGGRVQPLPPAFHAGKGRAVGPSLSFRVPVGYQTGSMIDSLGQPRNSRWVEAMAFPKDGSRGERTLPVVGCRVPWAGKPTA